MAVTREVVLADSASKKADGHRRYVFSPLVDFLCLGGGSLIILSCLAFFLPAEAAKPAVAAAGLFLADFINHPHFAHSYQIFYENFRARAFGDIFPRVLRIRYLVAAIIIPVLLVSFMLFSVLSADKLLLGQAANLMAFLVGWHYVKQGYGILIVDSVMKRSFFSARAKKILMVNAYICWAASWVIANRYVAEKDLFELKYYTFGFIDEVVYILAGIAAVGAVSVVVVLVKKWYESTSDFPFNGAIAYLTSLYLWLMFVKVNPLFIFIVPGFHSLQYLLIVWRYRLNLEASRPDANEAGSLTLLRPVLRNNARARFVGFIVIGILLGALGFYIVPSALKDIVDYDKALFGSGMFIFCFWVFINVHHYFIDNVIWRRENPETKRYIFGSN